MRVIIHAAILIAALGVQPAVAQTLDRVKQTGVLKLGVREDAAPYSFRNEIGEPAGYMVNLCRAVALSLKDQLGIAEIKLDYVPVGAEDRFKAVQDGKIDVLCGATTATLSRRELVDFSVATFIDGASVMTHKDGPQDFPSLAGKKIGVRAGTTTEKALGVTLDRLGLGAEVVPVSSHDEGLKLLEENQISAYFADQAILFFLMAQSPMAADLQMSRQFFTHEPYALALPKGDSEFRLAVDRALSRIYRTGAIEKIFAQSFVIASPSDLLKALYVINALPE